MRALVTVLDEAFRQRDLAEWRLILDGVGLMFGIVGTVDEVSDDEQMRAAGALVQFADGAGLTVASPFHIDGEQTVPPRRAPILGQHTEAVLREAGYSEKEIAGLRA